VTSPADDAGDEHDEGQEQLEHACENDTALQHFRTPKCGNKNRRLPTPPPPPSSPPGCDASRGQTKRAGRSKDDVTIRLITAAFRFKYNLDDYLVGTPVVYTRERQSEYDAEKRPITFAILHARVTQPARHAYVT
jgi:hypothetical protein